MIILREINVANKSTFSPSLLSHNFYELIQFRIQVNILKKIHNTKINLILWIEFAGFKQLFIVYKHRFKGWGDNKIEDENELVFFSVKKEKGIKRIFIIYFCQFMLFIWNSKNHKIYDVK